MASNELFSVAGRVAVVTGGTVGIGRMIAEGMVEAGMRVYVASRKADACERTAQELSAKGVCFGIPVDLSGDDGAKELVEAVSARESAVHLLVNNAGVTWGAPLEEYPSEAFARVFGLNVTAAFRLTVGFLPALRTAVQNGEPARVINLGSVEGLQVPEWENYAYPASKAAIHMLTRQLAKRLAPESITVNAIAPGPFPSRMIAFAQENPEEWDALLQGIPLGRAGAPDDIVGAVTYLASRAGGYVTGSILPLDGGMGSVG